MATKDIYTKARFIATQEIIKMAALTGTASPMQQVVVINWLTSLITSSHMALTALTRQAGNVPGTMITRDQRNKLEMDVIQWDNITPEAKLYRRAFWMAVTTWSPELPELGLAILDEAKEAEAAGKPVP